MTPQRPSLEQKLQQWSNLPKECNRCDISKLCNHKVYHSSHIHTPPFTRIQPSRTDILFIGEAPGQTEYTHKEPFIGPAGDALRTIIAEAVPPTMSYTIVNAVLCTPFTDPSRYKIRIPSLSEVSECSKWLTTLCRKIKPRKVVALGAIADKAVGYIRMNIPLPEHLTITHPSRIMQSAKSDYEYDNAILKIQEYLK